MLDKNFLRQLKPNGYSWTHFRDGIYYFSRKEQTGYSQICCSEEQLTNGDLEFMAENGYTLSNKRVNAIKAKYRKNKIN